MEAATNVGRDVNAKAVGPAARKPKAVVETTKADRRAFESSARLDANELLDADLICESAWGVPSSEATLLVI
jgi:hypothetical protein